VAVPSYDRFIEPLLRLLGEHPEGLEIARLRDLLVERVGLGPEALAERLPSGQQSVVANRIGWAHDRLKRAGYSESPRRGFWRLTSAGRAFLQAHSKPLTAEQVALLASVDIESRLRALESKPEVTAAAEAAAPPTQSPDELIDKALGELRQSVARDLLELIAQRSPSFFEGLVLDLLHAMGYGTSREELVQVGGSGDGGIDGIISLDRLGLEKVYVQAKRWKNDIGSPEIRGFMGALQLQGATKGVFITTSRFSRDARDAAERARGSVVLVDGERLAFLMIDHGVGVTHKTLRIPKLDGDYFDDA
jgi:restriction system protein